MNTNFLNSVTNFVKKRTYEFLGLVLIFASAALTVALITYSPEDPSFVYGNQDFIIQNFFGIYGSSVADFLLQSFGLISFLLSTNFLLWGIYLILKKEVKKIILKLFLIVAYLILGTTFIYTTFNNSFWLIDNGNSGFVGKMSYSFLSTWFPWIDSNYSVYGLLLLTLILFIFSLDINFKKLIILETFTPGAGSNSYKLTTGPLLIFLIFPSIPKSNKIFSINSPSGRFLFKSDELNLDAFFSKYSKAGKLYLDFVGPGSF